MKEQLLVLLILILTISPSLAFEDYLIMSDNSIKTFAIKDYTLASLDRVSKANDDSTLVLTPLKCGLTEILITTQTKTLKFDINVKPNNTIINSVNGLTFFSLEAAPTEITNPDLQDLKSGGNF